MVSFNQIPSQLRVPLFYAEFDNSRAVQGSATQVYKTLLIGNRLSSGSIVALSPQTVTSAEQAKSYFGAGSVLAEMAAKYLKNNSIQQLVCIALDDPSGGVKAVGSMTFTGPATKSGTISLMIGGVNIQVAVAAADTGDTIATAIAAAVVAANASSTPTLVAAAVDGMVTNKVNFTFNHKGLIGNELDLRYSYFDGEALPAGVSIAIVAMTGGTSQPDLDTIWPAIGDDQYILMSMPYTDSSSTGKMTTELTSRFGPLEANEGFCLLAKRASYGNLITFGGTLNSQFLSVQACFGPSNPWALAAAEAGQVAASGSIDPARPFQTLVLSGILSPSVAEKLSLTERNTLLYNGIATTFIDPNGNVCLEGVITTYQKNQFASPDESYLYLNTLLTLSFLRFDWKARITSKYPRHKLADDGTQFGAGQAVVTPLTIKAEAVAAFRDWEESALVENADQFIADLVVERDASNRNRLNVLMSPDLVNQLVVQANKIQFIL